MKKNLLSVIIKSKIVLFILIKYISYGLNFIKSILLANYLGPFFYGIWGFLKMMQNYMEYLTLGTNLAMSYNLSTTQNTNKTKNELIVGTVFFYNVVVYSILLAIAMFLYFFDIKINVFEKFDFKQFLIPVVVYSALVQLNTLFVNIYRNFGMLTKQNLYNIFSALLVFPLFFLFEQKDLLKWFLWSNIFIYLFFFFFFLWKIPVKIKLHANLKILKIHILRGIQLYFYTNIGIITMILTRTVVGIYYTQKNMGILTFAQSMSITSMIGIQTILWLFTPKLLYKFRKGVVDEELRNTILLIREKYLPFFNISVFVVIIISELVFIYMKGYDGAYNIYVLYMLCQIILSELFGFKYLITGKKEERKLIKHLLVTVIFTVIVSYVFAFFNMPLMFQPLSSLIALIYFIAANFYEANNLLSKKYRLSLGEIFPHGKYYVIFLFFFISIFMGIKIIYLIIVGSVLVIVVANKDIKSILNNIYIVISDNKIIEKHR